MKSVAAILAILYFIIATGCEKEASKGLPPATQTGANTFGCLANGTTYTAYGNIRSFLNDGLVGFYYNTPDSTLHISASNTREPSYDLELIIPYILKPGTYRLGDLPFGGTFHKDFSDASCHSYRITNTDTGSVTITYFNSSAPSGYTETIVAGTFEMNMTDSEGNRIHIMDGRFDIR